MSNNNPNQILAIITTLLIKGQHAHLRQRTKNKTSF